MTAAKEPWFTVEQVDPDTYILEPIFRLMGNGRGFPAIFMGESYFSLACESA